MLAEYNRGQNFKWLNYIKQILPGLLNRNFIRNPKATNEKVVNRLNDLYIQEWATKFQSSSKGRHYSIFKETINITETSPYSFGNFRKLSLYNCFMPI